MTKLTSTPAGAAGSHRHVQDRQEVLIERPEGDGRRRMTVMATKKDYDEFAEQLAAIGCPIVVGFEATGNYHRTLAHRLLTAGFELRLISSVALARTRRLSGRFVAATLQRRIDPITGEFCCDAQ